ncbi:anthranilate synthase component I family protein [Leucobacter sp. UT-8R-CII-1-4]|uniref:anthranilate synthase component I family protein n=1 Tax=Leucobacter sp. UT-8R-CII-1-4 TaxID=3040075 RepID=UPI0024A8DF85|nr:anthranilate synthase component I family protein [Leucobacter sp. UT-8R-CII-1-4]MDI6024547.1 anthranilate synthase component I family protein [Leucobacter sp. UT-8R-CII-1-4]
MVVRAIDWPRDTAAVARSLSRARGWYWLDGSAPEPDGNNGLSYLGAADTVLQASAGQESEFLDALGEQQRSGNGWVVALSYEFGVALLGLQPHQDDAAPAFALRSDVTLTLDHANNQAYLTAANDEEIDAWLQTHGGSLRENSRFSHSVDRPAESTRTNWLRSDQRYLSDVLACKTAIAEGDAYVLCLTDIAEYETTTVDPLRLYLELRGSGGGIRGGVIAAEGRSLVSVSPERFLSKRGGTISTSPIKGTRPRGKTDELDAILARDLEEDPKERAENLMIVDLMRNDLNRVCEPGTVHTEGFLRVEQHPMVHQLVSTVRGTLKPELSTLDAIAACFPGGSMTGAPKRSAVSILATLEQGPRGLYSGCFGWLGDDGDAEIAMSIRCVELRQLENGVQHARIGAGGGITIDSSPQAELDEKELKAAALVAALRQIDYDYP